MALFAPVFQQFFDNNGNPLAGGKLYTYEAGTTTNKVTYTSEDETTANSNPIILDAGGRADIWLESGSYKLVLDDSADVLVKQVDDITGSAANVFGSSVVDISVNTNITSVYQNNVIRTTATPITLTLLPAATAGEGFLFSVKNTSAGGNTIDPDAAELIDGGATLTLAAGSSTLLVCDGTGWTSLFIADDILPLDNTFTGANTFTGNNIFQGDDTFSGDVTFAGAVSFADDGELTISSGSITPTGVYHRVDTEGDAASDDLDTITAGTSGQKLILRAENDARDVVIKHNSGNIATSDELDITLGTDKKNVSFVYDTNLSLWVVTAQPKTSLVTLGTAYAETKAANNTSVDIPFDDTIPQNTEGAQILSLSYTPVSATSTLIIEWSIPVASSALDVGIVAPLFVDSTASAIAIGAATPSSSADIDTVIGYYEVASASTTARTYKIRYGGTGAVTYYVNSNSTGRVYGGLLTAFIKITEIEA